MTGTAHAVPFHVPRLRPIDSVLSGPSVVSVEVMRPAEPAWNGNAAAPLTFSVPVNSSVMLTGVGAMTEVFCELLGQPEAVRTAKTIQVVQLQMTKRRMRGIPQNVVPTANLNVNFFCGWLLLLYTPYRCGL